MLKIKVKIKVKMRERQGYQNKSEQEGRKKSILTGPERVLTV
jgi:hypothetical protein